MTTTQTTPLAEQIPPMCGTAGAPGTGDMNRDWECKRAARIYHLSGDAQNITERYAILARLEKRALTRRAALVRKDIATLENAFAQCLAALTDEPCTHTNPQEMTVEESLPACTC